MVQDLSNVRKISYKVLCIIYVITIGCSLYAFPKDQDFIMIVEKMFS